MDRCMFITRIDELIRDPRISSTNDLVSAVNLLVEEANQTTKDDPTVLFGIITLNVLLHSLRCGNDCVRQYMKQGMKFEAEQCRGQARQMT